MAGERIPVTSRREVEKVGALHLAVWFGAKRQMLDQVGEALLVDRVLGGANVHHGDEGHQRLAVVLLDDDAHPRGQLEGLHLESNAAHDERRRRERTGAPSSEESCQDDETSTAPARTAWHDAPRNP